MNTKRGGERGSALVSIIFQLRKGMRTKMQRIHPLLPHLLALCPLPGPLWKREKNAELAIRG